MQIVFCIIGLYASYRSRVSNFIVIPEVVTIDYNEQTEGLFSPEFGMRGTLMQIVPHILACYKISSILHAGVTTQ